MKRERCEYSDLWSDECAHCRAKRRKRQTTDDDPRPELRNIVIAAKKGTCCECHDDIIPGDHIGLVRQTKNSDDKVVSQDWAHYACGR